MARPINPNSARQQRLRDRLARQPASGGPRLATDNGRLVIPPGLIESIQANARERRKTRADNPELNPFRIQHALHPPAARPPKEVQMAMDSAVGWASGEWANGGPLGQVFAEGLAFPGYPYLTELAQRPEYRTFSETISTEMTRKWIKFSGKGTAHQQRDRDRKMAQDFGLPDPHQDEREDDESPDSSEKQEKIAQLEEFLDNLDCRGAYRLLEMNDGLFGRSHLFHEIAGNDGSTPEGREELQSDIGIGVGDISRHKVGTRSPLTALRGVEAVWTYPTTYNAINPLKADWYKPEVWYTMGMPIHASRLLTQIGRPVPDLLKPSYSFGGISMSQLAQPYVNIWLETRESIGRLVHAFSVMVLSTDLQVLMQPGGGALMERVNLFNTLRDNNGCFVINKNTEDFKNVVTPLSGLHELQAQSQEHLCSVARIPTAIYTGISPTGLNASSEGEIRIFENTMHASQESRFRQNLTRTINFAQLSLWDEIDPDITFEFVQLRELTEKEEAELRKIDAETDDILINGCQALSPEEVRIRIAGDENGPHAGIDPNDMPEPPQPSPGEGGPEGEGGGQPGEEATPGEPKPGGRINISGREAYTGVGQGDDDSPFVHDAEWNENDHPRAPDGKFGHGAGGAAPKKEHLDINKMKKVGGKLGSNEGGTYEDDKGNKFYIKKGKSPEHVKSEVLAAKLFRLAGGKTLNYKNAGPNHIATRWEKVDKNNLDQFNEAERKQARADFALHVWIANWDAAGTGNDNYSSKWGEAFPNDLGGALEWRAQGSPKGEAFGESVGEWDTMRDPAKNKWNADLFKDMTPEELRQSALRVALVPDRDIKSAVKAMGKPPEMADKLIARKRDLERRANGDPQDAKNPVTFDLGGDLPVKELNGIPFKAWEPPPDWKDVDGTIDDLEGDDEIDLGEGENRKKPSTGIFMVEPDGRVWLMRPTNRFGGYDQTIPKGGMEKGLTYQQNAIKEVWEETGLKARITGIAGDIEGDTSVTRYYIGEREAGDPTDHEWEASAVVLAPPAAIKDYLNRTRDRTVSKYILDRMGEDAAMAADAWNESDHPRDEGGKFTPKGSGSFGKKARQRKPKVPAASGEAAGGEKKPKAKAGSKLSIVGELLKKGATAAEVLKATGWPSVSMPAQAKALGLELVKVKEGKTFKYYGKPKSGEAQKSEAEKPKSEWVPTAGATEAKLKAAGYTDPEIKSVMNKQAEADAEKAGYAPHEHLAKEQPKKKAPQASQSDLEKAKKATGFYASNGVPPSMAGKVAAFNEKYAGKSLTDVDALNEKVAEYKALKAEFDVAFEKDKEAMQAAAQAKKEQEFASNQAKIAQQQKEALTQKQNKYDSSKGKGFAAVAQIYSPEKAEYWAKFVKSRAKEHFGVDLTDGEAAALGGYTNGLYTTLNPALRNHTMTPAQFQAFQAGNAALAKLPSYTKETRRGTSLTQAQQDYYQVGEVVQEHGFASSGKGQGWDGNTKFHIKGKSGKDVSMMSVSGQNEGGGEVLWPAKLWFKVTKREEKGGIVHIHMEEAE